MTRNPGQLPRGIDRSHAHHSDSLIDPATGEPYMPPSGEQRIRLLGPFTVDWDSEGIGVNGHVLVDGSDLSDDVFVIDAWAVTTVHWTTPDSLYLGWMNGVGGFRRIRYYDDMSKHVPGGGTQSFSEPTDSLLTETHLVRHVRKAAASGWGLGALTDGSATDGQVQVCFLVAEPAE